MENLRNLPCNGYVESVLLNSTENNDLLHAGWSFIDEILGTADLKNEFCSSVLRNRLQQRSMVGNQPQVWQRQTLFWNAIAQPESTPILVSKSPLIVAGLQVGQLAIADLLPSINGAV